MFFYLMVMSGLFYYFRIRGNIGFRVNGATTYSDSSFQLAPQLIAQQFFSLFDKQIIQIYHYRLSTY